MHKINLTYPSILDLFGGHVMRANTESRALLAWFLENYYRLDETEVYDCICDGNYDKGIDGLYVNEQLAQIDIFQSMIVKSAKTLGDTALKEFAGSLSQLHSGDSVNNLQASTKNKELAGRLRELEIAKKVEEGYEVRGIFITNAERDKSAIDFLSIAPSITLYDALELQRLYVPISKTDPIGTEISFDISTVPHMPYSIGSELEMVIAPLSAHDLIKMDGIVNGELFAWNVRQWLRKTKVNKDIAKSIQTPSEHKYFPAFHNGLIVLCRNLTVTDGNSQ